MTISVDFSLDTGRYELMVHHRAMSPMPAGPRLFRAPPHPKIEWSHEDEGVAQKNAEALRKYLADVGMRKSKRPEEKGAWD